MSTLLLRIAAPLQSWGTNSNFDTRRTEREPSKSGIIGMIAAAFGIKRDDKKIISDLITSLRFGVRIDKEGVIIHDFHTVKGEKDDYVTDRHYLSDAVFIVGLESKDRDLLEKIEFALTHPVYPIFLGRKSCPPTGKMILGIIEGPMENVFQSFPLQCENNSSVRMVIESKSVTNRYVLDNPISFDPKCREHDIRFIKEYIVKNDCNEHDPFSVL